MNKWAFVHNEKVITVVEDTSQPSTVLIDSGFWVEATDEASPEHMYQNNTFVRPIPTDPHEGKPPVISKLAMIERFSSTEYAGILTAAKSDVAVQVWYDRFSAANSVDLSNPRTIEEINMMVSKGLLSQERANSILNDPVHLDERA